MVVRKAGLAALVLASVACGRSTHTAGAPGRTGAGAHGGLAGAPHSGAGGDGASDGVTGGAGRGAGASAGRSGGDGMTGAGGAVAAGGEPGTGGGGGVGAGGGGGTAATAAGSGGDAANGGVPAGGASGGEDDGGAAGDDAAPEFPPRQACGTVYPPNMMWCAGLPLVEIAAAPILDADGNEGVSAGEDASVVITLHNTFTETLNTPCVGLLADDPRVTDIHGDSGAWNPWAKYFGINADQTLDFVGRFHLDAGIRPGTVIHFVAWTDLQTAGCVNGADVSFTLTVAP